METTGERATAAAGTNHGEVVDLPAPSAVGDPWPLLPGGGVGQSFRPSLANLSVVEWLVQPAADRALDVAFAIHADSPAGPVLASGRRTIDAGATPIWCRTDFAPIADSAGRLFCAVLAADETGLSVQATPRGSLAGASAYRDGAPVGGALVVRVLAAGPDARGELVARVERLMEERSSLAQELAVAKETIRRLELERAATERRLRALLEQLRASRGGGGADD